MSLRENCPPEKGILENTPRKIVSQKYVPRKTATPEDPPTKIIPGKLSLKKLPIRKISHSCKITPMKITSTENCPGGRLSFKNLTSLKVEPQIIIPLFSFSISFFIIFYFIFFAIFQSEWQQKQILSIRKFSQTGLT